MRWTHDGCSEGRIGPAMNVRTLNLRLNFLMSFLPVLLYYISSWSFKPRQCKEYSTFSGSGGPGFGSFIRVFSFGAGLDSCSDT